MRGAALLLLLIASAVTCEAATLLVPPTRGVYHSAHPDYGRRDDWVTRESVRLFVEQAGKKIVWSYVSFHWDKGIKFPAESCRILQREGVVPLVGIMPWSTFVQGKAEKHYTLERLLRGEFDRELRQCARDVRDLGFPIMMEFGPEVNGSWFPWNGAWNGRNSDSYGQRGYPDGPERFKDAFRHIVALFRAEGADDVTWVFHAAGAPVPEEDWNEAYLYYPGDEWVDWIGVSLYGRLGSGKPVKPFTDLMDRAYADLSRVSRTKPMAILELGVSEGSDPAEKAGWIRQALGAIQSGRYPRLKAVSWWNKLFRADGGRSTLEITSSRESREAYRLGVAALTEEAVWAN